MTRTTLEAGVTRRDVLKVAGLTGLGAALYASGLERWLPRALTAEATDQVPFYGKYQAGILTPPQNHVQVVAFDVQTTRRDELIDLLKRWTRACARLTGGLPLGDSDSLYVPPEDTGEAEGLSASHLTFTFGCGHGLFADLVISVRICSVSCQLLILISSTRNGRAGILSSRFVPTINRSCFMRCGT